MKHYLSKLQTIFQISKNLLLIYDTNTSKAEVSSENFMQPYPKHTDIFINEYIRYLLLKKIISIRMVKLFKETLVLKFKYESPLTVLSMVYLKIKRPEC